jgi:hypothetical protein
MQHGFFDSLPGVTRTGHELVNAKGCGLLRKVAGSQSIL